MQPIPEPSALIVDLVILCPKGNLVEFCGKFFIPNSKTEPSKFLSTFPGVPINNDYYILDTDYRDGRPIDKLNCLALQ